MTGGSVGAPDAPSNNGIGPDSIEFAIANNAQRVVPLNTEVEEVAIRAMPGNEGLIYIGFSEDVTADTGFFLEASDSITLKVDTNQQGVYAMADTVGDELRWIALS